MARSIQNPGAAGSQTGARLFLAAFGKHPGWDDHIPGISVQTVGLAHVKQTLYVSGIGGQIDSGAWDKLEPDKRLAGFDHSFLWSRAESLFFGRLWSSQDRRGRSKYPMVLCVEGFGVSPALLVQLAQPELEQLKVSCQKVATADEVTEACRVSQSRLDDRALQTSAPGTSRISRDLRQSFLNNPALGADRQGLLRVLHEITRGLGTGKEARSFHLRVPLCAGTDGQSELLWMEFLRHCLPAHIPMLLTVRLEAGFVDVLLGEPAGEEFFCLRASPQALPLATEIPYEIAPELKARLDQITTRFLEDTPSSKESPKPTAGPPRQKAGVLSEAGHPTETRRGRRGWWILGGGVGLVLAIGLGFLLFRGTGRQPVAQQSTLSTSQTSGVAAPVSNAPPVVQKEEDDFKRALGSAQAALEKNDWQAAIRMAERALVLRPNDPQATQIKHQAEGKLTEQTQQAELERKYGEAMKAAREAVGAGQWEAAVAQAKAALELKPEDSAARQLRTDAEKELAKVAAAAESERAYEQAMAAAHAALGKTNWQEALDKANEALKVKPDDSAALNVKNEAEHALAAAAAGAENERRYEAAMAAGQQAYTQGQWEVARTQAEAALAIKSGDAAATRLKQQAQARLVETADLQQAKREFEQGHYAKVLPLCDKHADVKAFQEVKAGAQTEQGTLERAQAKFAKADYSFIDDVTGQSYAAKPPFQALLKAARAEQQLLATLQNLKAQTNWSELLNRTSKVSRETLAKPPFASLVKWAQAYADRRQALEKLKALDTQLQILLVRFGVLKPTDKWVTSPEAQRLKPWPPRSIPLDKRQELLEGLHTLEVEYQSGGWLSQEGRQGYIEELRQRIPTW